MVTGGYKVYLAGASGNQVPFTLCRVRDSEAIVRSQTTNIMTGDPAFAVNRSGVIVLWNSAAEHMFGYPSSTVMGCHCWKLLSGRDTFGNQYCCERCPLREMAFDHHPVSTSQIYFKTAREGRKLYDLNCLVFFNGSSDGLLLHTCRLQTAEQVNAIAINAKTIPLFINSRGALTSREREVLTLLADGNNTHEIAYVMCISERTVHNHVQHTLNKLRVHNRLEAVVKGRRLGLV